MSAVKRSLNLGVVGMGRMGVPITRNIGFKSQSSVYLQVHSRNLQRAKKVGDDLSVDGVTCAMRLHSKYSTMTKWCDVIVAALADRDAARQVFLEDSDALCTNAKPGQIIVDHTTVDPELSKECAYVAEQRGAVFLDAPISGSPRAAFNGTLTLMVGGDENAFVRLQPIFRMYAENVHRMGDAGAGSAAKSVCQMLVAIHSVAAAEALKVSHKLGIENTSKLLEVLDASWASSTMLRRNAKTMEILQRDPDQDPPKSSSTVDRLLSDLGALTDGDDDRIDFIESLPLLLSSAKVLDTASRGGHGDRDLATLVNFIEASRHEHEDIVKGIDIKSLGKNTQKGGAMRGDDKGVAFGGTAAVSSAAAALTADVLMDGVGEDVGDDSGGGQGDHDHAGGGSGTSSSNEAPLNEMEMASENTEFEFY